jgi:hypothetical protein
VGKNWLPLSLTRYRGYDRLGGRVSGELVQVALDDGRGAFLVHATSSAEARRHN